jgi:hypothetical protein
MTAPGVFATLAATSLERVRRSICLVALGVAGVALAACSASPSSPSADSGAVNGHSSGTRTPSGRSAHRHQVGTSTTFDQVTTTTVQVTTTTARVTTTTASGVAQPPSSAQNSNGVAKGETTAMSIANVKSTAGDLSFTLRLRNTGTLPYSCADLKAQARTTSSVTAIVPPITGESGILCKGTDDTLSPAATQTFVFFIPLVGGRATQVIGMPFGSYASRVVWSVGGS